MNTKKTVLIVGSGGQLGSALLGTLAPDFEPKGLTSRQLDITDRTAIFAFVETEKPAFIINAAAYNKVEMAENNPGDAFAVNAYGPYFLAQAAKQNNAVFVHISTDYVFDGSKDFFVETDPRLPLNVYGVSKFSGEQLVEIADPLCYLIRTSALFGSQKSSQKINFVDRILGLAKTGKNIEVVTDQRTSPTYALDLAQKIKELLVASAPFGVYHITNSGNCSWYEFGEKILELAGLNAKISPLLSEDLPSKIKRPKNSILKNLRLEKEKLLLLPSWEDALGRYLKEKNL